MGRLSREGSGARRPSGFILSRLRICCQLFHLFRISSRSCPRIVRFYLSDLLSLFLFTSGPRTSSFLTLFSSSHDCVHMQWRLPSSFLLYSAFSRHVSHADAFLHELCISPLTVFVPLTHRMPHLTSSHEIFLFTPHMHAFSTASLCLAFDACFLDCF